jgi:hypothetical protein
LVVLATQTPLTRVLPAPHAARTVVTILSGCWTGASGTACADDASVKAKATAIILIMGHTPVFELTPHRQLVLGLMLETIHSACRVGPRARDVRFGSQADICAAKSMSALARIAPAKADHRKRSCLPYPQKRTCAAQQVMSALGQKRTLRHSFDHLVGTLLNMKRDVESERLGGPDIDNQLKLGRLFDR